MFMLISNETIKVVNIQKLANKINVEWRTRDRAGKQFCQ